MLVGAVLVSACGGGDADDASNEATDATATDASAPEATTATTVQSTTTAAETTTTTEETTTTVETTTTTVEATTTTVVATPATPATLAGPADGVLFTDTGLQYSLLIAPGWSDGSEFFPDGVQGWYTGNETDAFSENVNIVTNAVPSGTPLDLAVTASIETLEGTFTGFALIESGVVPGTNHPELGLLEYTAEQGGITIRFLQTFGLWNDRLVVFTGSTDAEGGEEALDALLDYALTIAPPAGS
jgi:hypothetical protein